MYIDIEHKLRTDLVFQQRVLAIVKKIASLENEKGHIPVKKRKETQAAILELFKLSGGNIALFLPFFFPDFDNGKPMTLHERPYAYSMYYLPLGGSIVNVGSRQIGKSTNMCAKQLMLSDMISNHSTLYICPYTEQAKTYATRLKEMYDVFPFKARKTESRQHLYLREFDNRSKIRIMSALTSAASIRGNTVDCLDFDEYQNFDVALEGEIQQTQKAAKMPTRSYSGTSLSTESALEYRYRKSSMGMWHVRCSSCGHHNNMGDLSECTKMVQPKGLSCAKCGAPIQPTTGQYIHMVPNKLKDNYIGLHTAQIMLPFFTDFSIDGAITRWNDIVRTKEEDPLTFSREVLGIATEQGDKEVSKQDIEAMCVLNSADILTDEKKGKYQYFISACDWGGSDHIKEHKTKTSYTVHVIAGVTREGELHIIHIKRYSGMAYEEIGKDILDNHMRHRCFAFGCDFGVGQFYINYVRKGLPDPSKSAVFCYTGPNTAPISIPKHGLVNQFSLNRTESLSVLFAAIKDRKIKACKDLPHVTYLYDMLNSFRVPSDNGFQYIRPATKADDTLHAVNFAYVLSRILRREKIIPDQDIMDEICRAITSPTASSGLFAPSGGMFGPTVSG